MTQSFTTVARLHGPRDLRFEQEPFTPDDPPADGLAARTRFTAISPGTELAAYRGDPPLRPMRVYPRLVGYCNVAEVVRTGSAVASLRKGDLVLTHQSHRDAFVCRENEILAVLPEGADGRLAALTYLFHLGYDALLKGDLRPGHSLAVVGLGALGLATVALGVHFGAATFAFSGHAAARMLASEFGASACFDKSQPEIEKQIQERTAICGADLVVTTSSSWDDWRLALRLARPGGAICAIGFPGRGEGAPEFNPLDSQYFYDKQLTLRACGYAPLLQADPRDLRFARPTNCRYLSRLIAEGKLPAERLILGVRPWRALEDVYQQLLAPAPRTGTYVLDWSDAE